MAEYGFGSSSKEDQFVYGAQRPGYPGKFVQKQFVGEWLGFMKKQGIGRVVCLLSEEELKCYPTLAGGLLGTYIESFGEDNVLWEPDADRHLCGAKAIIHICSFLYDSVLNRRKAVVHCSAGLGRTGHVLAAWLVFNYGLSERKALKIVEEQNRSPREAVFYGNASEADLLRVLGAARELDKPV